MLLVKSHKPQSTSTSSEQVGAFDYLGTVLQAGSLASTTIAINFGGTVYPWSSGQIIVLFVVGGILWVLFVIQQQLNILTTAETRIFPIHFLGMKEPVMLAILMAANNAGAFVPIYYIPLFFQFTQGSTALRSSVELLPLLVLITVTIMANGMILSKTGIYKPWYLFGSILLITGGVLMCMLSP